MSKYFLGSNEIKLKQDAMIVTETNAKGIITFVSKDFCNYAGYTKRELLGEAHNIIRNKFMPKSAFKDLWQTIKLGKKWKGVVVNSTKNGDYYWVKANVYPSQYADGSVKYISVRVKPTQSEVEEAMKLYPTLDTKGN